MVGVTVNRRTGTECHGSRVEGTKTPSRGRWEEGDRDGRREGGISELGPLSPSGPGIWAYLQCLDAPAANQGLQLGIDATEATEAVNRDSSKLGQRKGRRGDMTKPTMVQGSSNWKREWTPHYCRAMSTLSLAPHPHPHTKRGHLSFPIPQRLPQAGFCAPTAPNTPYLQLSKGLEGRNLDGPWEARTGDVDQLKENIQVCEG